MKKLGLFLACIMVVIATSGCGNKKLVCSYEENNTKVETTLNFDSKDVFKDGKVTMTMEAPEGTTDEEMNEAKEYFENIYKDFDVKIESKKNELVITMKMTKDNLSEFVTDAEDMSYEAILKNIEEDENTTCKKK